MLSILGLIQCFLLYGGHPFEDGLFEQDGSVRLPIFPVDVDDGQQSKSHVPDSVMEMNKVRHIRAFDFDSERRRCGCLVL